MKSKFEWYYNRLSLMSFSEILYRVINKQKGIIEKAKKNKMTPDIKSLGNFFINKNDLTEIKKFYAAHQSIKDEILEDSENILNHQLSYFALFNKDHGKKINWYKDYKNDIECEFEYYCKIDYKNYKKNGNIKYIWELNRFLHFYPLIKAYCLTSETKYAKEIIFQITDWIDKNPYLMGVNWTSSLELSIRLISWAWALHILNLNDYKIESKIESKILKSIYLQTDYISSHLSKYSSANNHIIGECAGMCIVSCLFNFGKKSKKWTQQASKILLKEFDKQIFSDGLNKEQTLAYHCFVFDFYLLSFLILEKNGTNISGHLWKKLEKMAKTLSLFADDNQNYPNIGDNDDGFAVKLNSDNDFKNVADSIYSTCSILFSSPEFKYMANQKIDEKTLWLLGAKCIETYNSLKATPVSRSSTILSESGYALLKDTKTNLIMDIGPLGYLSICAHGHADALAIYLTHQGEEFFIDPGTYAYHTKKEWRDYFRSTAAHNTIEIDGQNQSLIGGNFMWLKKADVTIWKTLCEKDFDYIRASHNGYLKQGIGIEHTRELLFNKNDYILIIDRLKNTDNKSHVYKLHYHLAENSKLEQDNQIYKITNNDKFCFLQILSNCDLNKHIYKGSEKNLLGWISRKFDIKQSIKIIQATSESNKDTVFISLISFQDGLIKTNYNNQKLEIKKDSDTYTYDLKQYIK